jgi:hypothetical protein
MRDIEPYTQRKKYRKQKKTSTQQHFATLHHMEILNETPDGIVRHFCAFYLKMRRFYGILV